jgi:thioredoxin 1
MGVTVMNGSVMEKRSDIITLTGKNFWKRVLESPLPFLVEIRADWSGSCEIMAPLIEHLAAEYAGRIHFGRLDIDANEEIAREFGVTELPFLLFFENGKLVDHIIGIISQKVLEAHIKNLLRLPSES